MIDRPWTKMEDGILRSLAETHTPSQIAQEVSTIYASFGYWRTERDVVGRAKELEIRLPHKRPLPPLPKVKQVEPNPAPKSKVSRAKGLGNWMADEDDLIRELAPTHTPDEIAGELAMIRQRAIKWTGRAVRNRCTKLGVRPRANRITPEQQAACATRGYNSDQWRQPAEPTEHMPGTENKIRVMAERVSRGEFPCHPDDAKPTERWEDSDCPHPSTIYRGRMTG